VCHRGDGGQASEELALVLPLVVLLALFLVQVGLVVRGQVLVTHASREGARAAAVDDGPSAAQSAVEAGSPLTPDRIDVAVRGRGLTGSRVTVQVRYRMPTEVPLVGLLVGDVTLTGSTTMRVE
jgi:hypothetical protein